MYKENIHTDQAPAAVGPYVQAVRVGELIFTAGQGGLDPTSGKLVEGGVSAQAKQTMHNLEAVLDAAGSSFDNVIKTNIFLRYIKDFAAVNEVYASFFEESVPARSTVAVSALPMATLVEIEMVALVSKPDSKETKGSMKDQVSEEPKEKKKSKSKDTPKGKKSKKKKQGTKGKKGKDKK